MKIKLDENLPASLASALAGLGHDVDTVMSEGINGASDDVVWSTTQSAGRLLLTQDLDFSDLRKYVFATHKGIIVLRLRVPGRRSLTDRVLRVFQTEDVAAWSGCFVVVTDHKIRVRKSG